MKTETRSADIALRAYRFAYQSCRFLADCATSPITIRLLWPMYTATVSLSLSLSFTANSSQPKKKAGVLFSKYVCVSKDV